MIEPIRPAHTRTGGLWYQGAPPAISALFIGWLISRLLFSTLRSIEIGPFLLLPGFLLAMLWTITWSSDLARGAIKGWSTLFMAGVISDSVAFWLIRAGSGGAIEVGGPFDRRVWFGSIIALGIMAVIWWGASVLGRNRIGPRLRRQPGVVDVCLLAGAAVITVIVFRVSLLFMAHLPNEERSLFVGGVEVHHSYQGAFLLGVLALLLASRLVPSTWLVHLLTGVAAGFILDQATYVTLAECTDPAYPSTLSMAGAIGLTAMYVVAVVRAWRSNAGPVRTEAAAKLLCHRVRGFGEFEHAPSSFHRALGTAATYLEVDCRVTSDGEIIVYHNAGTGAEMSRKAVIATTPSSAVANGIRYVHGEEVMWLDELLAEFTQHSAEHQTLCIDIKDYGAEEVYLEAVRRHDLESRVVFVSWAPQVLLRLSELGTSAPFVQSYQDLTRLGRPGRRLADFMADRMFPVSWLVALGRNRAATPLERFERGFQHGLLSCGLPSELADVLADQGGGVCVPVGLVCPELKQRCREQNLQLWVFSVTTRREYERLEADDDIDVIFHDDAMSVCGVEPVRASAEE